MALLVDYNFRIFRDAPMDKLLVSLFLSLLQLYHSSAWLFSLFGWEIGFDSPGEMNRCIGSGLYRFGHGRDQGFIYIFVLSFHISFCVML